MQSVLENLISRLRFVLKHNDNDVLSTYISIQMCNGCWGVVSRDGLGLGGIIDAPGYRAHSSVAMARMFKGIRVSASSSTPD